MSTDDVRGEPVAARIARWAERDAAIGLAAELEQARLALAERAEEVAQQRARAERLAQRVAQLTAERDRLQHQVEALQRPSTARRAVGLARRTASRALRR